MNSYKSISINRELENAHTVHFSHIFPGWGSRSKMVVSGVQAPFNEVFVGFNELPAIKHIFGTSTTRVLSRLPVGIFDGEGYAWVDVQRGRLRFMIAKWYLRRGRKIDIYLDVIHELVHVRQHLQGRELWDERFAYVDRPTEIEAYGIAVREARRLGVSASEIKKYLRVPWVPKEDSERLHKNLGIR